MKEAILLISFYSPDEYVYHEIIDPKEFWRIFDSLDDWSKADDYFDYVTEGVTLPFYIFDGKSTKLHVLLLRINNFLNKH